MVQITHHLTGFLEVSGDSWSEDEIVCEFLGLGYRSVPASSSLPPTVRVDASLGRLELELESLFGEFLTDSP